MKKRLIAQTVLVILMTMILGVGSAMAAMAQPPQPPYSSCCNAFSDQNYDDGETCASISIPGSIPGVAEARADQWSLGSRVQAYVDESTSFEDSIYARASFSQQFKVTEAGAAAINFFYEGALSASHTGTGTINGGYNLGFNFWAEDGKGNFKLVTGSLNTEGDQPYSDTFQFSYDFGESEVGSTFFVTLDLSTYLGTEGSINYVGDSSAKFSSDFFNTAKIDTVTGGLAPVSSVPIPGALWLMGSGLFGFVAVRRRKNS